MNPLKIPQCVFDAIVTHARRELPMECCGLLAGREGQVSRYYPLVNELASPVRFRGESRGHFAALKQMRDEGIDCLAVYHSHPTTAAIPSQWDHAEHPDPELVCVIISLAGEPPVVRAWRINSNQSEPIPLEIIP